MTGFFHYLKRCLTLKQSKNGVLAMDMPAASDFSCPSFQI